MKNFCLLVFTCFSLHLMAQVDTKTETTYEFTMDKTVDCTPVKSQGKTGTCWSFATSSFLESELIRKGKGNHDLSEMFVVRNIYKDKAVNYVLRQGKAQFSQGSLAHDPIRAAKKHGLVPEAVFMGRENADDRHDHAELSAVLKGFLDGVIKQKKLSNKWLPAFEAILDVYLGAAPQQFEYEGKSYSPKQFVSKMDVNPSDYISLTSYSHHPFYESFVLEIPDNYSNGDFYNLPMDELLQVIDHAVANDFSVAWDGDVSEKGFDARKGIAVLPEDSKREDLFEVPGAEQTVTQEMRQETLYSYDTTDDHLMHLVGTAKDQKGTQYYLIKNSWGTISPHEGFIYMSKPYVQLKTVAIMVHKDALPKGIAKKLF